VNNKESVQITFTTKRSACSQITINNAPILVQSEVIYLGLHFDQKLTWKAHIQTKRTQLTANIRNINWLICKKYQLSMENKLLIYKTVLKPIWTYGIELWGCIKPSNTKILQTFQAKMLRSIINAPLFVSNQTFNEDLGVSFINNVINKQAIKHRDRIVAHDNHLLHELAVQPLVNRRLERHWSEDLT
jgi:hypothetical protein